VTELRNAESLLAEVEQESDQVDDAPQYSLAETIARMAAWMRSDDPNPPDELIELFQSAGWWLRRSRELSPVTNFLKKAPLVNGAHAIALDHERISLVLMSERGLASMGEGATVEEAQADALNKLHAEQGGG
jgi:hypothetical protein